MAQPRLAVPAVRPFLGSPPVLSGGCGRADAQVRPDLPREPDRAVTAQVQGQDQPRAGGQVLAVHPRRRARRAHRCDGRPGGPRQGAGPWPGRRGPRLSCVDALHAWLHVKLAISALVWGPVKLCNDRVEWVHDVTLQALVRDAQGVS